MSVEKISSAEDRRYWIS